MNRQRRYDTRTGKEAAFVEIPTKDVTKDLRFSRVPMKKKRSLDVAQIKRSIKTEERLDRMLTEKFESSPWITFNASSKMR